MLLKGDVFIRAPGVDKIEIVEELKKISGSRLENGTNTRRGVRRIHETGAL